MKHTKRRSGFIALGSLVTATMLALSGAAVAQAEIVDQMPTHSAVVITKLEQPETQGTAANGLVQPTTGARAIEGVTFEAYEVPGLPEAGTVEWQKAVSALNADTVSASLGADATAVRSGTTDASGVISWNAAAPVGSEAAALNSVLPRGVYLIRETATPAGVVSSNDFLLAVPLTHPTSRDQWLSTIYVYPKNTVVAGTKTVVNADDFAVGNTVTWTIEIDNPSTRDQSNANAGWLATDRFEIIDVLDETKLKFADNITVTTRDVNVAENAPAAPTLVRSEDGGLTGDWYVTSTVDTATSKNTVTVAFTAAGRDKIATAKTANGDKVVLTLDTTIMTTGAHENRANFFSSLAQTTPKEVPPSTVKYGAVNLQKVSTDESTNVLSGAEFRVYLTEDAALQAKEAGNSTWGGAYNAETAENGYLVPAGTNGIFTTDAQGKVTLSGLRFSNFANGVTVEKGTDNYQTYWLLETKALGDHQLLSEPVEFEVLNANTNLDTITVTNATGGGFDLPLTGGMGTALLTAGGIALLAIVLVAARRRRNESVSAE